MTEYAVLDKDTIKIWIMPYLSVAKRGFVSKFDLVEVVNAILYKLKSGCLWVNPPYCCEWQFPYRAETVHGTSRTGAPPDGDS